MHIRILGTAAAEGIPAIGCDCETCQIARERGGRNIRSRSGALIDDKLKIDFGPDTLYHIHRDRLNPTLWRWIIFTHSHHDHCAHAELQYLLPGFAPPETVQNLRLFGNAQVRNLIGQVKSYQGATLKAEPMTLFHSQQLNEYTVIPVLAKHIPEEDCFNFLIEREGKRLLYACDTGWYPEVTWEFLSTFELDLLVIECTKAFLDHPYDGHLSITEVLRARDRLLKQGTLALSSRVVLTHFSHNSGALHEELETCLNPEGIEVGYDGMEITL